MNSTSASRRVVITGMAVISPLGNTKERLWQAVTSGTSGVGAVADSSSKATPVPFLAEAREFSGSADDFGPLSPELKKSIRKGLKVMCRESQMGVAAAQRALSDANLAEGAYPPERRGVVFGSDYMLSLPTEFSASFHACMHEGRFDFGRWGTSGLGQMTPLWLLKYLPNMPASHIAIYNDFRGPNNSLTMREASANLAVGEAFRVISRNHADMMLAGSTGTRVHPMKSVHIALLEELAGVEAGSAAGDGANLLPERASRPFDLHRTGMVLGEGAGAIVLEELNSALARGATILGEVVGAGSSAVRDRRGVAHRDRALRGAIRASLRDAGLSPSQIGHIQAHGLGTTSCDADEARAIGEVFGTATEQPPVTALKSYAGNLGAGSGLIELVAGTLALLNNRLFPILNYETPDPACPIRAARDLENSPGESFINLSVTPQGQASAMVVRRYR